MLQGIRWQLLALVLAIGIFGAVLAFRGQLQQPAVPTEVPATPTALPSPTPAPVEVTSEPAIPETVSTVSRTFREGLIGALSRLNPVFADLNPPDRDITSLIFEGLTRTNAYGEPEAALARSWIVSSDGLEYVFTLRDDVLWQDGTPFSSADVAYTMEILRAPDFPGSPALGAFWRTVETQILGPHLVRFRLTQPLGTFLDKLQIGMLPEHALRGTRAQQLAAHPFNLTPIGTGPYQLERIEAAPDGRPTAVVLRAAPVFGLRPEGSAAPGFERIQFNLYPSFDEAAAALDAGLIDGLAAASREERQRVFDQVNTDTALQLHTQIEATLGALIFNWQRDTTQFFREQRVRVALYTGLDRSALVERNLSNAAIPANSPLMPGSWAFTTNLPWPAFNPTLAAQQLASEMERANEPTPAAETPEATAQPSPSRIAFSILVPDDPALTSLAQEIATQWSQLNVDVSVESVSVETYRERLNSGAFDATLVEYSLGNSADPDVYAFWNQGQTPPEGLNYGGADDGRISELLERARRESGGLNRIQLYHDFQRLFAERVIAIPIYYPLFTYALSADTDGVQLGFIGSPADRFRNLREWYVDA